VRDGETPIRERKEGERVGHQRRKRKCEKKESNLKENDGIVKELPLGKKTGTTGILIGGEVNTDMERHISRSIHPGRKSKKSSQGRKDAGYLTSGYSKGRKTKGYLSTNRGDQGLPSR